jgi:hypothetical protein
MLRDQTLVYKFNKLYELDSASYREHVVRVVLRTRRLPAADDGSNAYCKDKSAAMWIDGNVSYSVQRIINQHSYEHFRRWIFTKEEDVRGFGDTAMMPTIGVSTNEKGQHIFYWWKPPMTLCYCMRYKNSEQRQRTQACFSRLLDRRRPWEGAFLLHAFCRSAIQRRRS